MPDLCPSLFVFHVSLCSSYAMIFFLQVKIDGMAKAYQSKRYSLALKSSVTLAHLLAARDDVCNVVKTSSGSSREKTTCAVNKVREVTPLIFLIYVMLVVHFKC